MMQKIYCKTCFT